MDEWTKIYAEFLQDKETIPIAYITKKYIFLVNKAIKDIDYRKRIAKANLEIIKNMSLKNDFLKVITA